MDYETLTTEQRLLAQYIVDKYRALNQRIEANADAGVRGFDGEQGKLIYIRKNLARKFGDMVREPKHINPTKLSDADLKNIETIAFSDCCEEAVYNQERFLMMAKDYDPAQ